MLNEEDDEQAKELEQNLLNIVDEINYKVNTVCSNEQTVFRLCIQLSSLLKKHFALSLLKKWIDISKECGIEYFEISHLFTQWGAKHAPKIMAEENGTDEPIIFF